MPQNEAERPHRGLRKLKALLGNRRPTRTSLPVRLVTGLVCVVAATMIVASALSARGTDLRPDRNTDLVSLLEAEKSRNAELSEQVQQLRTEVEKLTRQQEVASGQDTDTSALEMQSGLTAVTGPALTITLTDAPPEVQAGPTVTDDDLVVHQQDIQAVVNALWAGGAEAMTIQDQRVVSTTGIKCVGNTVVLHGVPYAPPYVITAIGDPVRLAAALESSQAIRIYKQYVEAYGLGWSQQAHDSYDMPGYQGAADLEHASVPG